MNDYFERHDRNATQSREAAGDSPQASSIRPLPEERGGGTPCEITRGIVLLCIHGMLHSISSKSLVLPYGKYRGWPTPLPPTSLENFSLASWGAPSVALCVCVWPFFRGRNRKKHLVIIDRIQDGAKSAQDAPREPHDRLKIAQDGPKSSQDGPKIGPDGPKIPQDGPKSAQDGPKIGQDGPKICQDVPRIAPRGSKIALRTLKFAPRVPRRTVCIPKATPRVPEQPQKTAVLHAR